MRICSDGENSMSTTIISSVDEFQKQLKLLATDEAEFIYRGQADIAWKVNCSAARRLNLDPTKPIENQLISPLLVGYLEYSSFARARSQSVASLSALRSLGIFFVALLARPFGNSSIGSGQGKISGSKE